MYFGSGGSRADEEELKFTPDGEIFRTGDG